MEEGGELVERGTFRVDRERAMEKLARFRLQDKRDFVCALVRVATLSGATKADFDVEPGKLTVKWDGRALSPELLKDPLAGLLGTVEEPVAVHLGAAYLGAMQAGAVEVTTAGSTVWQARWKSGVPLGMVDHLRMSCSGAPLRLTAEGAVIEPPPTAVSVMVREGVLRVWPAPADASEVLVRPYVAGVGAEPITLQSDLPPLAGSLIVPGLSLDASLGKVVRDAAFEAALEAATRALIGVERAFANEHRASQQQASAVLRDRELSACWVAEDQAAPSGGLLAAAVFGNRPKHEPARRRWAAHAGRRVRWLQAAAARHPDVAEAPIFPAWDGTFYSATRLQEVFREPVRASTADQRSPLIGEDQSRQILRLSRPGDFKRLQAALPRLTLRDVSPRD